MHSLSVWYGSGNVEALEIEGRLPSSFHRSSWGR